MKGRVVGSNQHGKVLHDTQFRKLTWSLWSFLFLLKVWTKYHLALGVSLVCGKLSIFLIQLLHFSSNDSTPLY